MGVKVVLLVALFCMLQCEVRSHEFLKNAYNSVKNAVVKGYHSVAHVFMKHDHNDDDHEHSEDCEHGHFDHEHPDFDYEHPENFDLDKDEKIQDAKIKDEKIPDAKIQDEKIQDEKIQDEILTTTIQPVIDVRFKEEKTEDEAASTLNRRDALNDDVPDINNRFFINAPCGEGTRRKGSGCRQVIYN